MSKGDTICGRHIPSCLFILSLLMSDLKLGLTPSVELPALLPLPLCFLCQVKGRRGTVMELNVEQVKVNRGVSSFSLTEKY